MDGVSSPTKLQLVSKSSVCHQHFRSTMATVENTTRLVTNSGALNLYARLREWESTYDTHDSIVWAQKHADLPIFAIAIYLIIVFYVPDMITRPWKLRRVWSLWNLALSVFSMIGVSRTVPHLLEQYLEHGFNHTICSPPESWYLKGVPGAWVSMFIFSKVPELLDTVFLVLQKKPVIFLHWFHHVRRSRGSNPLTQGEAGLATPCRLQLISQSLLPALVFAHPTPRPTPRRRAGDRADVLLACVHHPHRDRPLLCVDQLHRPQHHVLLLLPLDRGRAAPRRRAADRAADHDGAAAADGRRRVDHAAGGAAPRGRPLLVRGHVDKARPICPPAIPQPTAGLTWLIG